MLTRRVPTYLIIGAGRLSKHLQHYFCVLDIPYKIWARKSKSKSDNLRNLETKIQESTHILLAIPDDNIEEFIISIQNMLKNKLQNKPENKIYIHFSGALYTKLAYGAHPLMSFSNNLYEDHVYSKIPFILDDDAPDFKDLFPMLNNPNFKIDITKKTKYHMLCVLANNFTTILWEKVFADFEDELNIPKDVLHPILAQTCNNLSNLKSKESCLTGPLVRKDFKTINKHLEILKTDNDDFLDIYQDFTKAYAGSKN